MYKKLYFIGFAIYVVLLAFSIQFAKERIIFIDMACNLFYILMNNGFTINHYRFGDAVSQLFPLMAMKAGLSLQAITIFYSAGYIIYSLIAYLVCGILKRYDFALIVLFQNLLFSTDTFYALSQLPQSITLIIILFALIAGKQLNTLKPQTAIIAFIILVTIVFFHPLGIIVVLFSVVYFILNKNALNDKKLLYMIGILYFAIIVFKFLAFRSPYENHSMSGLKNFITLFPDYIFLYSNRHFLHDCLTRYYWIPLLFTGIVAYYIYSKEWKKLWFFVLSFFAYLMLVNICYPSSATPEFYIENLYLPLGIFLSLPFVFDVVPVLEKKNGGLTLVLLISVTGMARIYNAHTLYTARLDYYRKILDEYGEKKTVIDAKKTNMNLLMMVWGSPYELLILSETERHKPASIIIDEHADKLKWTEGQKNVLLVNWNIFPYEDMPKRYFQFSDTTSGYYIDK